MNRKIVKKFQFSFSDILNVLKQYTYQQTNKNIWAAQWKRNNDLAKVASFYIYEQSNQQFWF